MEITTQKINTEISYDHADNEEIVSRVTKDFDSWDDDRQFQITTIEKIAELLDMAGSTKKKSLSEDENKKTLTLKDADIKEICNSSIAHTYNSTFKTPSQMFNVDLESVADDAQKADFAHMQKAAILNILKKSKAKKEFRKAVENWYKKGEMIFYINWAQDYQLVRRKVGFKYEPLGIDLQKYEVSKQLKYDGAKIKCIDPENFVFDTSRSDDFENCPKIYKTWVTYSEIANNEKYKSNIKAEDLAELKKASQGKEKDNSNVKVDSEDDKGFKDGMIEVLEYQGDISIVKDGKTQSYPNMKVVVVGRKYTACFEYNPNIINSFVWCPYEVEPTTGRGISSLACLIPHSEATTETLNKVNKALGLSINKCYLVPKSALPDIVEVKENGVIEYDPQLMQQAPIPMDFSSGLSSGINFLQYLEGKKEQATGRFKYSTGDTTQKPRTAREATITQAGQNALVSYEQDIIAEMVITIIEKVGELMANFQDKPMQLKYKNGKGEDIVGTIDETIRQNNYVYTIGDTQSSMEKKMNGLEALQALPQIDALLASTGKGRLNPNEVVQMWGSIYEQENPSKIIEQTEEQPPKPQPMPTEIQAILANYAIGKLQLPDEIKVLFAQEAGLMGGIDNGVEPRGEAGINPPPRIMPIESIQGNQGTLP